MTKFIVISGPKQVGKDTTAHFLKKIYEEHHIDGDGFAKIVHFADALKEACIIIFGLDRALVFGSDDDKNSVTNVIWPHHTEKAGERMTIRELLQFVGTDLFRKQLHHSIWSDSVFNQRYSEQLVIVADCRFMDEAQVSFRHGSLIKITRKAAPVSANPHQSETEVNTIPEHMFRYVFHNDGPIESVETFAHYVLKSEGLI